MVESLTLNFTYHIRIPTQIQKMSRNVSLEVKQEMMELLDHKNKAKAKKAIDIEEIRAKLRGTMGGCHRNLIDEDEDEEEEKDDAYMYPANMTPDERAEFQVACRASKVSE